MVADPRSGCRTSAPGVVSGADALLRDPVVRQALLPEGTRVEIVIPASELSPELQVEFDAWERAGDEAWAQIDEWEREPQS